MTCWIDVLRKQCADTSQTQVSRNLRQKDGFPSATIINQVLRGSYPSEKGKNRLRVLIEGRYMGSSVECPALGEIPIDRCAWWQEQPRMQINPLRSRMHRACKTCPNRREN